MITGASLRPVAPADVVPLVLQADVYRQDGAFHVPLAVSAGASGPWVVEVHVVGSDGAPVAAGVEPARGTGDVRVTRELTLSPGGYEAVVTLRVGTGRRARVVVERCAFVVPGGTPGQLVITPIVVGDHAEPAQPSGASRAFVFGPTSVTPAASRVFRQDQRLNVALRVFGWTPGADGMPDLSVEYLFRQRLGDHLRFFNKTKEQKLGPQVQSPDPAAGVTAGMSIPLAAFPPGQFEVQVRGTDLRTKARSVRAAQFTVAQ
jgi:hypothetical protein